MLIQLDYTMQETRNAKTLCIIFKYLYTHISKKIQTTIVAFPHNSLFNSKYNTKQRPNRQP